MPDDLTAGAAILVIAAVTFGTRISGSLLMSAVKLSPRIEQFLDSVSVCVIAALVATILAKNGLREVAAVACAIVVMFVSKRAVLAMISGTLAAALWYNFPG